MGEHHFATVPAATYGVVAVGAALAYFLLQTLIVREQGVDSKLATALGSDLKGKVSPVLYLAAVPLAFANHWIAVALYVVVALMWLVPDRRVAQVLDPTDPTSEV
jgi:uncharacterized membrane protein